MPAVRLPASPCQPASPRLPTRSCQPATQPDSPHPPAYHCQLVPHPTLQMGKLPNGETKKGNFPKPKWRVSGSQL
ncbi:hypothetical protein DSO57_1009547 [Entomophthora muscae]|uniref:Uncharacterized protein n=1 Tax=Entomophthora muscae TaxID=34485 RepID=A0ACC2S8Q2_9FUNG|nr:hypothetical protein DSO57_1009547 [Entomophthora muscae]